MAQNGLGNVSWWGLSPAFDVLPAIPSDATADGPARVLLVGAGDARHILTTMARMYRHPRRRVIFYVVEPNLETMARQMLFLRIALESPDVLGLREKTETFLELFGNAHLRPQTRDFLTRFAEEAIEMVTNLEAMKVRFPLLDLSRLKYKERDFLECILKFWRETDVAKFPLRDLWDGRNRQYLETRYDFRRNAFDWDYNMKLADRGAKMINAKQYADWRERGHAFECRDGCYEFPNRTFSSGVLVHLKGERVARRGYFGDIVTSPYIVYGLEPEDKRLLKTQNGIHVTTAADISNVTVTHLFHEIAHETRYVAPAKGDDVAEGDGAKITDVTGEDGLTLEEIVDANRKPDSSGDGAANTSGTTANSDAAPPLIRKDDVSVVFLPLAPLTDLVKKEAFHKSFHFAFFSNSLVHTLVPETKRLFTEGAELVVESTKFVLDLKKEYHDQYASKIVSMAEKAGFKPKTTFDPLEDALARFRFVADE